MLELVKLSQVDGRILVLMYQLFLGRCRTVEGLKLGGVDRGERLLGRAVESKVGRVDNRREIHGADVDCAGVQGQSSERGVAAGDPQARQKRRCCREAAVALGGCRAVGQVLCAAVLQHYRRNERGSKDEDLLRGPRASDGNNWGPAMDRRSERCRVRSAVVKQGAGAVMEGGAEPEVGQSQYV